MQARDALLITVTPAIVAAAYGSGDLIGSGALEMVQAAKNTKAGVIISSLVVIDKANQKSAIDLYIFNSDPGSVGSDNGAVDFSSAVLASSLVGRISIAGADYVTAKAATNAEATKQLDLLVAPAAKKTSLWVVPVSRGTPTYASASDLVFKFMVERI